MSEVKKINIDGYIKMTIIRELNNIFGNKRSRLSVAKLRRLSVGELQSLYNEVLWAEKDLY